MDLKDRSIGMTDATSAYEHDSQPAEDGEVRSGSAAYYYVAVDLIIRACWRLEIYYVCHLSRGPFWAAEVSPMFAWLKDRAATRLAEVASGGGTARFTGADAPMPSFDGLRAVEQLVSTSANQFNSSKVFRR